MTEPPSSMKIEPRAAYILLALIALNLLLHLPFLLTDSFGESDAARIALVSLQLAYHQEEPEQIFQDPIFSAPLYAELLRLGLNAGLIQPNSIISWMTIASYFASALITAMVFIFTLILTRSILAASGSGLLLQLNPTFWLNSIYGFPTIVAIAFLLVALICFQIALINTQVPIKVILVVISCFLFLLAIHIKIDVIFAGLIFCLPVWNSISSRKQRFVWLAALAALALGSLWVFSFYTQELLSDQLSLSFYSDWNLRFPIEPGILFSRKNLEVLFRSAGLFSIPLAIVTSIVLMKEQRFRLVLLWVIAASLTIIIFWGLRRGNSARHNILPNIFLVVLLALPLSTRLSWRWGILLGFMCIGNYFILPSQASTASPSGRLAINSQLLKASSMSLQSTGRTIAELSEDKIAVIGNGPEQPYYLFELFRNKNHVYINSQTNLEAGHPEAHFLVNGRPKSYLWSYNPLPVTEIVHLIDLGYFSLIGDRKTAGDLERHFSGVHSRWRTIQNID